ncbi:DUF6544 family protein [Noviherbaspirillum sp.]|uniref:DUF6544 family protein n=1 Tax=Noviherbaspirillum sp. TaxID=1926288 RepID=UPI002D63C2B6|nr:DUF6544 family protein [Noviherbaspirillum sp.]HZW20829.1 DUF6544 family protein [Noviherbaspirillum sp.]
MTRQVLLASSVLLSLLIMLALLMQGWRMRDERADDAGWAQLHASQPGDHKVFEPAMVQHLPDPARRYFLFTIAPGTPLVPVSEIRMHGEIGLGSKDAPGYQPMRAHQILAPPHGFIWRVDAGSGAMRMSGSDGMLQDRAWTRFWLNWTLPVVRAGDDENVLRSAFGRVAAEAAFWAPASLLPGNGVIWESGDGPNRARATVRRGALTQSLEMEIAEDGRPLWVMIPRWSNVNPEGEWRVQPFGGTLADFRSFGGYTLPTRVDGGNHFGTPDYFPFFRAQVEEISFPRQ